MATCASSRARWAPRQKCGPRAKARCRPALGRRTSNRSGLGEHRRVAVRSGDGHRDLVTGPDAAPPSQASRWSRTGRRPPRRARAAATPRPPRAPGRGRRAPARAGRGVSSRCSRALAIMPSVVSIPPNIMTAAFEMASASVSGPAACGQQRGRLRRRDHLTQAAGQLGERRRPGRTRCAPPPPCGPSRPRPAPRPRSRRTRPGPRRWIGRAEPERPRP